MTGGQSASNITIRPGAGERLKGLLGDLPVKETEKINHLLEPAYMDLDEKTWTSRISFQRKTWAENRRGEIHGGIISTMFDQSTGWTAVALVEDMSITTSDLQVSFIKPFMGERFCIESELVYAGNHNVRMRGTAYDLDSGKVLAMCTATFARI